MGYRTPVAIGLLAVVAAAATLWLVGSCGRTPDADEVSVPSPDSEASPPAKLEAPGLGAPGLGASPRSPTVGESKARTGSKPVGEVRGRAVFTDGRPAEGATVWREGMAGFGPAVPSATAIAGDDGRFSLPAGYGDLRAVFDDGASRWEGRVPDQSFKALAGRAGSEEPKELLIALVAQPKQPPPGRAWVRVLGPDGKPLPWGRLLERARAHTSVRVVVHGRAELASRDSQGSVEVFDARTFAGLPLPYAHAFLDPLGDPDDVRIQLESEVTIEGRVTDAAGDPVPDAKLTVEPTRWGPKPTPMDTPIESATSGTDGRFRLARLGPFDYRVRVEPPAVYQPVEPLVARGGTRDLSIFLRRGHVAALRFVDEDGKPVAKSNVSVRREGTWTNENGLTDADGIRLVAHVDPAATYSVIANPPQDREDVVLFRVTTPLRPEETFVVPRALVVSGWVRDASGRPVPGAYVQATGVGNSSFSANVATDGAFRVGGLPPGDVTLYAGFLRDAAGTRRTTESPRIQVPAGTRDVALVLDVGATLTVLVEEWPGKGMNVGATLVLDSDPAVRQRSWIRADGRASFLGLRSDVTYSLWIEPVGDLSLLRAGVRADDGELRVQLEKGKSILVTLIDVPRLGTSTGCYAENPVVGVVQGFPDAYGRQAIRGLPAGTYVVHGTSLVGDTWWSGEETTTAGSSVEVTLRPKK